MGKNRLSEEELLELVGSTASLSDRDYLSLVSTYLLAIDAYYNQIPFLKDSTFDRLEREIHTVNPDEPALKAVGSPIREKDKSSKHSEPMLSTDKALDKEALLKWAKSEERCNQTLVGTAKLDGIACDLHYSEGLLIRAASRGNGTLGSDITAKMRYVVPSTIKFGGELHVRGEVVLSFNNFEKLNELLVSREDEPMANPRNAAAGIVVGEDALDKEKLEFLTFVGYRLLGESKQDLGNFRKELAVIEDLGFVVPEKTVTNLRMLEEDAKVWDELRSSYKYPVDGVVYRVDDEDLFLEMGTTSKFHRGAVAYKFPPDVVCVVIEAIEWHCGSRDITPVARIKPVFLDGAVISKAALHSVKNMIDIGAAPGEKCILRRSGGVIPWLQAYDADQVTV